MNTHTKRHYPALETLKKRLSSILAEVEEAQAALEALPAQIAPTAEQTAELARQLAEHGGAEQGSDPLSVRAAGYDPAFTPDPEDFGNLS